MKHGKHGPTPWATLALIVANLLIPVAIVVFAKGFFPYKPLLPGLAQYDDRSVDGPPPAAPFDRIVFMVVDALRRYYSPGVISVIIREARLEHS